MGNQVVQDQIAESQNKGIFKKLREYTQISIEHVAKTKHNNPACSLLFPEPSGNENQHQPHFDLDNSSPIQSQVSYVYM